MKINLVKTNNPGIYGAISKIRDVSVTSFNRLSARHEQFRKNTKDLGNNFLSGINRVTDNFLNRDKVIRAISVVAESGAITGNTIIYPTTTRNMRSIGYRTRQFNMANPKIMRLYRLNRLNGYDGIWKENSRVDEEPTERIDYLLATDGFIHKDNDKILYRNVYSADDKLNLTEKLTVQKNWEFLNDLIAKGEDPTELIV